MGDIHKMSPSIFSDPQSKFPLMSKSNGHPSLLIPKTLKWAATGVGVLLVANALYKELAKFKVEGKVVLITGGSRGLGLVLARELASRGAKLALCARSADKLELARQQLEKTG